MGNTLSTSSDVLDSLDLTDTCGLDEVSNIGNDLLTRTLITKDTRSKRLLVTKLYALQPTDKAKTLALLERLHKINKSIQTNSTGLLNFITRKAGKNGNILLLQRQYLPYNLADRIITAPFFSENEKIFLSYQIIHSVYNLHSMGNVHGDIKPENILLTSSNTPYLSDYAPYKPFYLPDDNPYDLNFFFNRSTYLAPERYTEHFNQQMMFTEPTQSSDIFSLGCVLAYLFLETSLFDVSNIIDYRNGKFDVTESLSKIKIDYVRELITKMVDPNPEKRPKAKECFETLKANAPQYFQRLSVLSYGSQQQNAETMIPLIIKFMKDYLHIEKPVEKVTEQKVVENQVIQDEATLSHSSQLASELESLTNQTEKLHKHLQILLSGQWNDSSQRKEALETMKKLSMQIQQGNEKEDVVKETKNQKKYFSQREQAFQSCSILLNILFSIRKNKATVLENILSLVDILICYTEDDFLYTIVIPGLVDVLVTNASNGIKSHALKGLISALHYLDKTPPTGHLLFPNYICPAIEQTIAHSSNNSFAITYASYFSDLLQLSKKLALKEEDGSMKNSEHETLCNFFLQSYKQMIDKKNFHITKHLIKSYASLTLFCGSQRSYNELLEYISQFQQLDSILILYFLEQIPLVGKVYGTKIFELHFYPLLQQYLYSTHEYLVYQTLLSLTTCVSLDIISRSYIYSIIPSICPLLVHPNITLRQTTALLLEISATKLTDAQRHCFLLPHVNSMLRIRLFNITAPHINASLLSSIPRNALKSFDRNDFSQMFNVEEIVTKLENTGVTNPDKCLNKLIPYLTIVKEHVPRLSIQTPLSKASDDLKLQQIPLWGIALDDSTYQYIPMQNPTTPCPRDHPRSQLTIKGSPVSASRSLPDIGTIDYEIPTPKIDPIQGTCVSHLTEHRAPITCMTVGSNGIFFVTGDSSGKIKVWDIQGVESMEVMRSKAQYQGPSAVTAIGTIAKSTSIVIGYKDGTIEIHKVSVDFRKMSVVNMTLIKSTTLNSKIVSIEKNADPKSLTIICENGILAIWDIRDKTIGIKKENDVRLGYVSSMAVAPSREYCIVGTNRGYLVCWDLRHTIANIGWRVPNHSCITDIVFTKDDHIATNTRDGDVYCWDIRNQNLRSLLHFEDFGIEIPELSSVIEKVERSRFKPSFSMGPDDYGAQQLNNLLQNLQTCIAQNKNNIYLPYLINTSLIVFGKFIISGGSDHVLRFWDVENPQNNGSYALGDFKKPPTFQSSFENNICCVKCFPLQREKRGIGIIDNDHHLDSITSLVVLPSSQAYYLCSASRDGIIKIWK